MESTDLRSRILGSWRTPEDPKGTIDSEWGPIRIRQEFRANGQMVSELEFGKGAAGDGVIRSASAYELKGSTLYSDEFGGGPVTVWIDERDHLIVECGNGEIGDFVRD